MKQSLGSFLSVLVLLVVTQCCLGAETTWQERLFGAELTNARGEKIAVAQLQGKTVGLYFSAHWCPPCRRFTPQLVECRQQLAGKPFEIVFVSHDREEAAMRDYMTGAKMPWLAVPFAGGRRRQLAEQFGVRSIPTLIILDAKGQTVTRDGRFDVMDKGAKAYDGWQK